MSSQSEMLDNDIAMTHQRFVEAVEKRLPTMSLETKERYFAVLSMLVSKLEDPQRGLNDIVKEMMIDAAGYIVEQMNEMG